MKNRGAFSDGNHMHESKVRIYRKAAAHLAVRETVRSLLGKQILRSMLFADTAKRGMGIPWAASTRAYQVRTRISQCPQFRSSCFDQEHARCRTVVYHVQVSIHALLVRQDVLADEDGF